ncbi:MAG: hypothetical protein JO202_04275 [Ktedonobacteraceae bacterium]|nr:hypothetical protein [Ktedonobacteraceae bacterium]
MLSGLLALLRSSLWFLQAFLPGGQSSALADKIRTPQHVPDDLAEMNVHLL